MLSLFFDMKMGSKEHRVEQINFFNHPSDKIRMQTCFEVAIDQAKTRVVLMFNQMGNYQTFEKMVIT